MRYILCLCMMTQGVYAEPWFTDQTAAAGLAGLANVSGGTDKRYILEAHGNGAGFFDYDNDGHLDLYVVNGSTYETFAARSGPGNSLWRNNGDGTFADCTAASGSGDPGWGAGLAVGDYNNDGWADLYVTNYGANILYRNNGDGTFADDTGTSGGADFSASAAFFDYDNDGDLDLYVVNYVVFDIAGVPADPAEDEQCIYLGGLRVYCGPQGMEGGPDRLYRNDRGVFVEVTAAAGIDAANAYYGLGVVPADYDNDGHMDLFVANDETPNVLFRNHGNGRFTDVALDAGVAYNADGEDEAGMGVDAGDYDNDGDLDFYVTNFYRETNTLYRNHGDGTFVDATVAVGLAAPTLNLLGWGTKFFDYDNDTDLDLFVANGHVYPQVDRTGNTGYAQPNQLFRNDGVGGFVDVGATAGPGLGIVKVSRGAATADYDNDGDLDLFVVNLNERPDLLRNEHGSQSHWLTFLVMGTRTNRDAVGARITVHTDQGRQMRTVNGASSYLSHSDRRVHFGLGQAQQAQVRIEWPDGTARDLGLLEADRIIHIVQGKGIVVAGY